MTTKQYQARVAELKQILVENNLDLFKGIGQTKTSVAGLMIISDYSGEPEEWRLNALQCFEVELDNYLEKLGA